MVQMYGANKMFSIVAKEELENLAPSRYRFKGIDTSPLAKWLSPKWDALVHKMIPSWMAPNVLTVSGLALLIVNFFLIISYRPLADNPAPRWVWLVAAFNAFWGYALDCMDGKQARRTKTSSALGELIDHGCDAFSIWTITFTLGVLTQYSESGPMGEGGWTILFWMFVALFGFFSAHWESYNTHQFFLPWSFDVGEISVVLVFLVSFVFGHEIWLVKLPQLAFIKENVELREFIGFTTMSFVGIDGIRTTINVLRTARHGTWWRVIEPPLYIFSCFFSVFALAYVLPAPVFAANVEKIVVILGFDFCNLVTRLILAHVAERSLRSDFYVFIPIWISIADIALSPKIFGNSLIDPVTHIWIQIAIAGANHLYYAVFSTRAFCNRFNIHCFKIAPSKAQ